MEHTLALIEKAHEGDKAASRVPLVQHAVVLIQRTHARSTSKRPALGMEIEYP